jgi:hypothetical protein
MVSVFDLFLTQKTLKKNSKTRCVERHPPSFWSDIRHEELWSDIRREELLERHLPTGAFGATSAEKSLCDTRREGRLERHPPRRALGTTSAEKSFWSGIRQEELWSDIRQKERLERHPPRRDLGATSAKKSFLSETRQEELLERDWLGRASAKTLTKKSFLSVCTFFNSFLVPPLQPS